MRILDVQKVLWYLALKVLSFTAADAVRYEFASFFTGT
jgi:hypothetical protein